MRHIVYLLLVNHGLQMIFLRDFYDENRRVNTKNKWVWGVHLVAYGYVAFMYYGTDITKRESSQSTKMWIPLDILLTIGISMYQVFYNYQ